MISKLVIRDDIRYIKHNMKKGLLIIGGGMLQIPAIKRAKELGFTVHLLDGYSKCMARSYADFFYLSNTKDVEACADVAVKLRKSGEIIGVYTQGTDVAYTVAYCAEKAGLPGISPEAAFNTNNKIKMRENLEKNGLGFVRFVGVKNASQLNQALKKVGFPCYVKPADNSASRGITRLVNNKNAEKALALAIENCHHSEEAIIESEIEGLEYSVDTVIYDHKLYPAGISDRIFLDKKVHAVQIGSRTPSVLPEKIQEKMYDLMDKAAKALKIDKGAFKGDLIVDKKGNVKIIEVTARTSGGFDSQLRKPLSFGIDIIKATIDIACGYPFNPIDLIPKWVKWTSTISVFPKSGKVISIKGVNKLKQMKGLEKLIVLVKPGDIVEKHINCAKRTNYAVIKADTLQNLIMLENKFLKTLVIKTK